MDSTSAQIQPTSIHVRIDDEDDNMITSPADNQQHDAWCDSARAFIQRWTILAQIHLAMNTLAALAYSRAYKLALSVVTVLTVLVGSKGVSTLIGGSTSAIDIAGGIAEVLLGITAGLLTNFELKAKSEAFNKRAAGYGRLAATLQAKTLIHDSQDRARLTSLILSITEQVQARFIFLSSFSLL